MKSPLIKAPGNYTHILWQLSGEMSAVINSMFLNSEKVEVI